MAADIINLAIEDLKTKIEAAPTVVGSLNNKAIYVYDQDQLLCQSEQLTPPYIGVIYEGMTSDSNAQKCSTGGLSGRLRCGIFIVTGGETFGGLDLKPSATNLLNEFRECIRLTKSPSGHTWQFVEEILAPYDQESFGYIQRWQVKVQLTQGLP